MILSRLCQNSMHIKNIKNLFIFYGLNKKSVLIFIKAMKIVIVFIVIVLQYMKGNNESINQLSIDQIYAGIQLKTGPLNNNETLKNTQSQKPHDSIKPKFYAEPRSDIKTEGPKRTESLPANVPANVNYQISKFKAGVFVTLALIPIIWIGVIMGTCQTKYRNHQICAITAIAYSSSYYYQYSSYALSESECCDPYKIIFGIWFGSFLAYILVNVLVLVVRPPSMSNYFTGILLFSKAGQGEACFSKCCSSITLLIFWPIITVVAIISGIIYLLTLCCEEKQPQQN